MLIGYNKNNDSYYEKHYIDARRKIDILCGLIVSGGLSREDAVRIYKEIENDFADFDSGESELFNLIYENRVNRLCNQFCRK